MFRIQMTNVVFLLVVYFLALLTVEAELTSVDLHVPFKCSAIAKKLQTFGALHLTT